MLGTVCHHVVGCNCYGCVSVRIVFYDIGIKLFCNLVAVTNMGVVNLVSDWPHDEAGMIPVTSDPACGITLAPVVKEVSVVKGSLWFFPHVKGLVINHKAHLVAQVHPCNRRRIVGAADWVYSHFLQAGKLSSQGIKLEGGTQGPLIMMVAGSVDFLMPSVKEKALVICEFGIFKSAVLAYFVNYVTVCVKKAGCKDIEAGGVNVPELGIFNCDWFMASVKPASRKRGNILWKPVWFIIRKGEGSDLWNGFYKNFSVGWRNDVFNFMSFNVTCNFNRNVHLPSAV